jgi:hypothetical protein
MLKVQVIKVFFAQKCNVSAGNEFRRFGNTVFRGR